MKIYYAASASINPDFKSREIVKALGCEWSHVLHIIEPTKGMPYIWHSTGDGVNKMPLHEFLVDHRLTHKFDITDKLRVSKESFICYLEGNEGKDYSETQYFGFLPDWMGPVKLWVQKLLDDNESELICSEFTSRSANGYTSISIIGDEDYIDPRMFVDQLIKQGMNNLINNA